jgi:hypothetical protein
MTYPGSEERTSMTATIQLVEHGEPANQGTSHESFLTFDMDMTVMVYLGYPGIRVFHLQSSLYPPQPPRGHNRHTRRAGPNE